MDQTLLIGDIKDISFVNYPKRPVSVIFLGGCPFRCPFCQNSDLVLQTNCTTTPISEIRHTLDQYTPYVNGVCITGGEPLMQYSPLEALLRGLRSQEDYLIKLDTNGFYPRQLDYLLSAKLIDYVAIDIKTALDLPRYQVATHTSHPSLVHAILTSLHLLSMARINVEIRTTVVPTITTEKDIVSIAELLAYLRFKQYTLQQFSPQKTLDLSFSTITPYSIEQLRHFQALANYYLPTILNVSE